MTFDAALTKNVEQLKNEIAIILAYRQDHLNHEITTLVYNAKLAVFYNAVSDTFLEISDSQKYLTDLLPEQQQGVLESLDALKKLRREGTSFCLGTIY